MTVATSSERSSVLARKDRTSSLIDKLLFFSVFFCGAVAIVILKESGIGQFAVTSVPVCLMLFYLVCTLWTQRYVLSEDRAGDNIYYMGFLFTLVSIAYSLYEFTTSEDAAQRIIVNFGIALATTIVGLALRVTLMQVRGDPSEVERIARTELSEAAINLKHQLNVAIEAVSGMQLASQQAIADISAQANKNLQTAIAESASNFKEAVSDLVSGTNTTFRTVSENTALLTKSSSKLVGASEKLVQRLEAIELPSDILDKKFENVASNLFMAAQSLERFAMGNASTAENLSAASSAVSDHSKALKMAAEEMKGQVDDIVQLGPAMKSLAGLLAELHGSFRRNQDVLTNMVAATEADLESISAQRGQIRVEVEQATKLLIDLEGTLVSVARNIVEKLNAQ